MRKPTTPDCLVTGCKRAAYKYGICRKHHALLPMSFRMQAIGTVFAAYNTNAKRAARLARQIEKQSG